jgi:putative transposase
METVKVIPEKQLVFIDESGIEDNACRWHGWSLRGLRCYGERIYRHKRRVSMIAGLCNKRIIAPIVFEGNCDAKLFEAYVEDILIKELTPGQTIALDNISFHKTAKVRSLIESIGCKILYLPTYSPDLNPIEHYWFKVKNEIRKAAHQFEDFFDAVYYTLKKVTTLVR